MASSAGPLTALPGAPTVVAHFLRDLLVSGAEFWLNVRKEIPPGALLPVIRGKLAGQEMTSPDVRRPMADLKRRTGLRRRVAPHQFRHGFAVEASREGIPLYSLQGQLGHAATLRRCRAEVT